MEEGLLGGAARAASPKHAFSNHLVAGNALALANHLFTPKGADARGRCHNN